MKAIKIVSRIKNFGIFDDFNWDTAIPDFKKHNLIYGWNYSGKTTLSRVFQCFERKQKHEDFPTAEFELIDDKGTSYNQSLDNLSQLSHIRVFNRDYVDRNLGGFSRENKAIPIFIFGEENIRLKEELDKTNDDINELNNELRIHREKYDKLETEIEDSLTSKARDIKNTLSLPDFTKEKLKPFIQFISDASETYVMDDTKYGVVYRTFRSVEPKHPINLGEFVKLEYGQIVVSASALISKQLGVSLVIEELRQNPKYNRWVKEGREIHEGKDRCLFCDGNLTPALFDKLDKHFSEEYKDLENDILKLIKRIDFHLNEIEDYEVPKSDNFLPELSISVEEYLTKFNKAFSIYKGNLRSIVVLLNEKNKRPFDKHEFKPDVDNSPELNNCYNEIKSSVLEHNEKVLKIEEEREKAKDKLLKHSAAQFVKDEKYYDRLINRDAETQRIKEIEVSLKSKTIALGELKRRISKSAKGAEKVNEYLFQLLRRNEIRIREEGDKYFIIERLDKPALNLSEGEKTVIALAYFMASLEDINTELSNTIIFLDDPVSSLDYNHLFGLSALIKSKLANCRQLFISSHNLEFFNLMKDFVKHDCKNFDGKGYGGNMPCYLIQKNVNNRSRTGQATVKELPVPLLKYKTEYNYLYSILNEFRDKDKNDTELFEVLYLIPNILRRFIEGYLNLRLPNIVSIKDGIEKLDLLNITDRERVQKLLDEYSHEKSVDHSLKFPDAFECKEVIGIVLDGLERTDKIHFDALIESCQ